MQMDYQDHQRRVFLFCLYMYVFHGLNVPLAKSFPATSYLLLEIPFLTNLRL